MWIVLDGRPSGRIALGSVPTAPSQKPSRRQRRRAKQRHKAVKREQKGRAEARAEADWRANQVRGTHVRDIPPRAGHTQHAARQPAARQLSPPLPLSCEQETKAKAEEEALAARLQAVPLLVQSKIMQLHRQLPLQLYIAARDAPYVSIGVDEAFKMTIGARWKTLSQSDRDWLCSLPAIGGSDRPIV